MKPERALHLRPEPSPSANSPSAASWAFCLALIAALLVWLFAWHLETAASAVSIWNRSETYAHGFLIFPISAYLIWLQREKILAIAPLPSAWGIAALVGLGLLWLASDSVEALVVSQYALVAMVPALVWAVLGYRVFIAMLFPLLFLLFAVPVGDFLLAPMMNFTADFTVTALRLTGIPVFREGNFFTVPSGSWSVVEACSGLRYLIASLTLGCLFSYLTYRSLWRRVIFIGLSIVVPIIANGLRAYMIVMIGHLSNNRLATGVDHVIYGWVFFGFVMMLLFWIGSKWREPDEVPGAEKAFQTQSSAITRSFSPRILLFAVLSALAIAIWPGYAQHLDVVSTDATKLTLAAPNAPQGWEVETHPLTDWEPHYLNASGAAKQAFERDGKRVEVLIKFYRNQHQGAEVINTNNQLVSTRDQRWGLTSDDATSIATSGGQISVSESTLRSGQSNLLVWHWYWIGGMHTSNSYLAKIYQAKTKMLGKGDDAAAIFIYLPFDGKPDSARATLREFVPAIFQQVESALSAAKNN